jgi:hypothetical protein
MLFALALTPGLAHAAEFALPSPGSPDWQPLAFRGVERTTAYTPESFEGIAAVRAESHCAASGLVLPLDGIDLDRTPLLSWRWRVDRGLDISDEKAKAGDDFAARVYLMFRLDSTRASALLRLRHRIAKLLYGEEVPGSALNFVWASRLAPGTVWNNPFEPNAKMIALTRGELASWRSETVDISARYAELFGVPAPPLMALAIMSDSDNSCQGTQARFGAFKFLSAPDADARDGD